MPRRPLPALFALAVAVGSPAWAGPTADPGPDAEGAPEAPAPALAAPLQALLDRARAESHAVRAARAERDAASHWVGGAGRLPEPTLTLGAYVQPVETRVGAQQGRVSLQQGVPWPGALRARGRRHSRARVARPLALGGMTLTRTVEGRERYGVRVRYQREERDSVESRGRISVPTASGDAAPLSQLAHVQYVRGPQMIKAEDTFLTSYVDVLTSAAQERRLSPPPRPPTVGPTLQESP